MTGEPFQQYHWHPPLEPGLYEIERDLETLAELEDEAVAEAEAIVAA